jgi:Uma2 family endonuclease
MSVRERTFEEIALADTERPWELHHGILREKPAMSFGHNFALRRLHRMLLMQLDPASYEVSVNASRVHRPDLISYIPDLIVIPVALTESYQGRSEALEVYLEPLPLVVEVWSPSTGQYDVDEKLPEYQARGDLEIWRIHPFERTVMVWRRQSDGSYEETLYREAAVPVASLPGVEIDIRALFAEPSFPSARED